MSRFLKYLIPALLSGLIALAGCSSADDGPLSPGDSEKSRVSRSPDPARSLKGSIVVANRGSGSISVIDSRTREITGTFMLPYEAGENLPEPMYVNGVSAMQRVFVGDRANNRVVVFNARNFEVVGTVPAGAGVFHQWADRQGQRLWVNNDIDNTITVIDTRSLMVIGTIDIPADLVAMGGKPHDVVLDHTGQYGFVTILGIDGPNDYLVQYDAQSLTELNRQPVGQDPHLAIGQNTDLYVPSQGSNEVRVFDPSSLGLLAVIDSPGAHGATISPNGRYFYTTNLPGGGDGALVTIRTQDNTMVGEAVDSPFPVPHNLALAAGGKLLFVTHSGGAADKVSMYRIDPRSGRPEFHSVVTVGLNPFGIGFVN